MHLKSQKLKVWALCLIALILIGANAQAHDKGEATYKKGMKYYWKDSPEAFSYFQRAAAKGNVDAMKMLGRLCVVERGDYVNGVKWFRKAAELGNTMAMWHIGVLYENGIIGYQENPDGYSEEKDYKFAMEWFQRAASLGNTTAMRDIGRLYEKGKGVAQSDAEEFQWSLKAAKLGDRSAMYFVGEAYYNGTGVDQDYKKSMEWFQKCLKLGNHSTIRYIVKMYRDGKGVPKNVELADKMEQREKQSDAKDVAKTGRYYAQKFSRTKAKAEQGDVQAMVELAGNYHSGLVLDHKQYIKADMNKAIYWCQKAAAHGSESAMYDLGNCYLLGMGFKRDFSKAMLWYQKAAIGQDEDAMYSIGKMYNFGHGVQKDHNVAIKWWKRAARRGNRYAIDALRYAAKQDE